MNIYDYINAKLASFLSKLDNNLNSKKTYCTLSDLNFTNGKVPDYSVDSIQYLYLLRYFPAYLLEYYSIYKNIYTIIFNTINKSGINGFKILSIGSGSGIDYMGAQFSAIEFPHQFYIAYTGIDAIKWLDDPISINPNNCYLINNINIDQITNYQFAADSDIIFFPKSIGEFTSETWDNLKEAFKKTVFSCPNIVLAASIRTSHINDDKNRLNELAGILNENKYFSEQHYSSQDTDVALRTLFPYFIYPDDIINYILLLPKKCPKETIFGKIEEDECPFCNINRKPILTTKYIQYEIIFFTERI